MTWARACAIALVFVAAGLLLHLCIRVNLARSCPLADPPYLFPCQTPGKDTTAQAVHQLRHYIANNPGAAQAYVQLGLRVPSDERVGAWRAAALVAPSNPNVMRERAALALQRGNLPLAIGLLVPLVEGYHHLAPGPARALANLVAAGHGGLLADHLRPGSRWLANVLDQMGSMQLRLATALPLVTQANTQGVLDPGQIMRMVTSLKDQGSWADAYALWLWTRKQDVPLLYNSGFDRPFIPGGFDWEVSAPLSGRSGAQVVRRSVAGRGQVMEVDFSGRRIALPIVRQHLMLGPGTYKLAGQYTATRLRSEHGLMWTLRCGPDPSAPALARSGPLLDTKGEWMNFEFPVVLAAPCADALAIQLEFVESLEATTGMRGMVAFDALSLRKTY